MSSFTSSMAFSWSGVSTNGKRVLQLVLPGRVGAEREARARCAGVWYSTTSSWAISRTADRTRLLAFSKSAPPRRWSAGDSPPT